MNKNVNYISKIILLIVFSIIKTQSIFSQKPNFTDINFLLQKKVDSVVVSCVSYWPKEWASPLMITIYDSSCKPQKNIYDKEEKPIKDTIDYSSETIKTLKQSKLSKMEFNEIDSRLKNKSSYDFTKGVALLNDANITITYYVKDSIVQTASISQYTRKITLKTNGCKKLHKLDKKTNEYYEMDPCFFYGRISSSFEKYLTALLIKKHIWSKGHKLGIDN